MVKRGVQRLERAASGSVKKGNGKMLWKRGRKKDYGKEVRKKVTCCAVTAIMPIELTKVILFLIILFRH